MTQTSTPTINVATEGDVVVSGTAIGGAIIILTVNGVAYPAMIVQGWGKWTQNLTTVLKAGDLLTATAQLDQESISAVASLTVIKSAFTVNNNQSIYQGYGQKVPCWTAYYGRWVYTPS